MAFRTGRAAAPGVRERSFGLTFAAVALLLALWLAWRGRVEAGAVAGSVAVALLLLALARPLWLKLPSDLWWLLAHALGWVNSRVLLLVMFFVVLAPVGLLRRLFGADPLRRRRGSTSWVPYPSRYRDPNHYERLF